jgi:hypothetical protein
VKNFLPRDDIQQVVHWTSQLRPFFCITPRQHIRKALLSVWATGTPSERAAAQEATLMFSMLSVRRMSGANERISRRIAA